MIDWFVFNKNRGQNKTLKMKIVIIDDHQLLLDGLKSLLDHNEKYDVVRIFNSAEEAIKFLSNEKVDLVITDYQMPGMDGLAFVHYIKKCQQNLKIIVVSQHDEKHLVKEILKAGVEGYILKKDTHHELINAIEKVKKGEVYLSSDINQMLIQDLNFPEEDKLLTDREREILKLIAKEYTNKMIAEELFISERTVETHRKNIFRKTKTNSLVGLIKFAYANNLI